VFCSTGGGLAKGVNQSVKLALTAKLHNTPFVVFFMESVSRTTKIPASAGIMQRRHKNALPVAH
jgi:hypothetical protein